MNHVLHIVGKDLRRLWWWLLLWAGVLALPILLGFRALAHGPAAVASDVYWNLPRVHAAFVWLEGFVAYVLTVVLIQEDALVGTRQFWLTRPIARGQLLAAKALGAAVILGLVPTVISLPWWLWCGFGVNEITVAALEWFACATLVALPAALLAVLTDSLARALLWTMVLVAVVPVAGIFFGVVDQEDSMALAVSRSVFAVVAVAVEITVVIVVQYHVRWRGRGLIAAGALMVGTVVIAIQWPWTFVARQEPTELNAGRGAAVQVKLIRAASRALGTVSTINGLDVMHSVDTQFLASGLPTGTMLMGVGAEQQWRFGDAFGLKWSSYLDGVGFNEVRLGELRLRLLPWDDGETYRWLELQRPPLRPVRASSEVEIGTTAQFRPSLVARMRSESPSYTAQLWMDLARGELGIEVPLAPGRWQTHAGRGMRIERIGLPGEEREAGGADLATSTPVLIVETRPLSLAALLRERAELGVWFAAPWTDEREGYVLLNRARGEFVFIGRWGGHHNDSRRELLVNGVRIQWIALSAAPPHVVRGGKWVPAEGWSSGLTLGRAIVRREATFVREVKVERFDMSK